MSDRFRDNYRIPSARARWWDYSQRGIYFITICTEGMECWLGEIASNEMHLSDFGKIATEFWMEIPNHFPFVKLHAYAIMPNHVHGIIEILHNAPVETLHATSLHASMGKFEEITRKISTETLHATSLQKPPATSPTKNRKMSTISPCKGSLGSIVRSYKSAVSKQVHKLHPHFGWQERFYDNIIKNTEAYHRIEVYIHNNVRNWEKDCLYKK